MTFPPGQSSRRLRGRTAVASISIDCPVRQYRQGPKKIVTTYGRRHRRKSSTPQLTSEPTAVSHFVFWSHRQVDIAGTHTARQELGRLLAPAWARRPPHALEWPAPRPRPPAVCDRAFTQFGREESKRLSRWEVRKV